MAAATEIRIWMKNDVIVRFRPIRSRLLAIRSTFQDGVNSTSYGRDEHLFLEKKMTVLGLSSNVKGNGSDFGCADWLRTQSDFSLAVCLFVCLFVCFFPNFRPAPRNECGRRWAFVFFGVVRSVEAEVDDVSAVENAQRGNVAIDVVRNTTSTSDESLVWFCLFLVFSLIEKEKKLFGFPLANDSSFWNRSRPSFFSSDFIGGYLASADRSKTKRRPFVEQTRGTHTSEREREREREEKRKEVKRIRKDGRKRRVDERRWRRRRGRTTPRAFCFFFVFFLLGGQPSLRCGQSAQRTRQQQQQQQQQQRQQQLGGAAVKDFWHFFFTLRQLRRSS